jgi:hypothetical protein
LEALDLAAVLKALSAGDYVPACAALLALVTRALRRRWFDPHLEHLRGRYSTRVHRDHLEHAAGAAVVVWGLGHARAFLPLLLAGLGWLTAVALGADVAVAGKAFVMGAAAAMAGYDTAKGAGTVLRALAANSSRASRIEQPGEAGRGYDTRSTRGQWPRRKGTDMNEIEKPPLPTEPDPDDLPLDPDRPPPPPPPDEEPNT